MSSVGALPPEIITDVLSRLPVKSLCRFKSVSPSWNSLISDPHFAKTHLNRTKTLNPKHLDQKAIIISSSYNLYSLDFASVNPTATKLDNPTAEHHFAGKRVQVLSSCDGLLLVSYDKKFVPLFNFFLLNPCTREFKKLPAPPYNFNYYPTDPSLYGVVFDSSADDYKVVMLSLNEFHATMVDVYSLKTNAWRRIKVPEYIVVSNSSCGVFFNGCLHRIFWKLHGLTGYSVILAFNLSDEVFEEVPLPALLPERHIPDYREEVVGGCLCLVYKQPCDRPDVWMMKEYGVRESWTKNTLDLPPGTPWGPIMCLLRWLDKCLLYSRNGNKVVICDLGNETTRDMVVAGIPREYIFGATYVESLISPNQGGGIGRQEGLGGNKRQASSGHW